jgi:hypothetical protein
MFKFINADFFNAHTSDASIESFDQLIDLFKRFVIIVIFEISNRIIGLKNNDVILNPRINLFENQQFGSFAVFFISVQNLLQCKEETL